MSAVAIDSLEYAHQLEAVGMPREQAEAVAKGLTTMFIHNFDSLVTKDYLDTRFSEFQTRIEGDMERRFSRVDNHFAELETKIDKRFVDQETSIDIRFAELETDMASHFTGFRLEVHGEIGSVRSDLAVLQNTQKLHSWMFALLITGISTIILQNLFL